MARQNEISSRRVAKELDLELIDVSDFACCGFPVKSMDAETTLLLAARNLSVAEELDLDICTICSGCAITLTEANKKLKEDNDLRQEVNRKLGRIGREYSGRIDVVHFAKVLLKDLGLERIGSKIKKSLEGLTIATHYGCHYFRPSHVYGSGDDPEFPTSLDELVAITGAKSIDYEDKTLCCGGIIIGIDEDAALHIAGRKLDRVKDTAADIFNLICPLCSIIYDRNQRIIERRLGKSFKLPVLFYTQILGLALGIEPKELGLNMNRVDVTEVLRKI